MHRQVEAEVDSGEGFVVSIAFIFIIVAIRLMEVEEILPSSSSKFILPLHTFKFII